MYTLSVFSKAVGGIAGRVRVYPDVLQAIDKTLRKAKGDVITDAVVTHIGDRVVCLTVCEEEKVSELETLLNTAFVQAGEIAASRNLFRNPAPSALCSLTFSERVSETFVLLMAGSDDPLFWSDIVSVSPGQAAGAPSVMLCRTEGSFSTTAELLEMFVVKEVSRRGVSPLSLCDAAVVRTKVVPVVALGFSMGGGRVTGPLDLFDSPQFDAARMRASKV